MEGEFGNVPGLLFAAALFALLYAVVIVKKLRPVK